MPPRTQTRPRTSPARTAPGRPSGHPTGRRPGKPVRAPRKQLISADQRRELSGIGLVGVGVLLGVVLAIPGGGSIARPVHDALLGSLGIGAWVIAAGLIVTGARLLGQRAWTGGALAAAGSILVAVAMLGFFGLIFSGSAGSIGQRFSAGLADRLGGAATAALMLVLIFAGLVLAVELRIAPALAGVRGWLANQTSAGPASGAVKPVTKGREPAVNLTGTAAPLGFMPPPAPPEEPLLPLLPLPPLATPHPGEPPEDEAVLATPESFTREFEGRVEARPLGAIPEVAILHGEGATEDEPERVWVLPSPELLDTVGGKRERLEKEVQATAALITSTLASFSIQARVVGANSGPTVTQYELQPAAGVPVRKIVGAQTDLSLALAAPIRIQPFIPGKSAVGIEVPNKAAQGSGKSVCINAILAGFLLQATPAQLKLILIDPKRVELSTFADVPHLLVPVVVEPEAAVASLRWACKEMEERYKLFASHGARNIAAFNERAPGLGVSPLPYVVIVIDELADLMMVAAGEIEDLVCRVAQLARAVGIHLIVATQRPSADIITGLIKANIPSRAAFAVSSGVDSRVIIDEMGAEKLLGRGDMLYLPIDEGKPRRLQGAFCSDRELEALIDFWKQQGKPEYQEEVFQVQATVSWARDAGKRDPLFAKAAHTVAAEGRAAASLLQRKLNVGYTRAARLVDQLAEQRVVGPFEGSKSREVLMDVLQVDELLAELGEE